MKAILETVKRYVFEIVCGAVAVLAIVLGVLGLNSMGEINTEMQQVQQLRSQIESQARSGDVKNSAWVKKAQERIDLIKGSFTSVLDYVRSINQYKPILQNPHKATIQERESFGRQYQAEVASWLTRLRAGWVPTEVDVQRELDLMSQDEPKDTFTFTRERADEPWGGPGGPGRTGGIGGTSGPPYGGPGGGVPGGIGGPGGMGGPGGPQGGPAAEGRRQQAAERAAMRKAKSILCYATRESFQQSPISMPGGPMYDVNTPPTLEQAWYAQLELWIQRDIVEAIATINERRAAELTAENKEPWVGDLPIKEIVSIQMSYYVQDPAAGAPQTTETSAPGGPPPMGGPIGGPTTPGTGWSPGARSTSDSKALSRAEPLAANIPVFTGRFTNDLHEVLRFSVRLVVDARDIPAIVAGLCEKRFHVPLRVSYEAFTPDPSMTGKIYGEAPLAVLTIDFESMLFSEFYLPIMPDPVLQALNKTRPEPPTSTEG